MGEEGLEKGQRGALGEAGGAEGGGGAAGATEAADGPAERVRGYTREVGGEALAPSPGATPPKDRGEAAAAPGWA